MALTVIISGPNILKTLVSLGMEYCNESVILILTKIVGNLTKYFVEIILDQPIVGRKWFKITYFT